jgi:hypothetical protein
MYSTLNQALNWEDKKRAVINKERQTEKKMRNAYNKLRSKGNTTVKAKNIVNAFTKYPDLNVNHYLKNSSAIKHFSKSIKQRVLSRKLNDLPTRINDLESRVSSLEKILQRTRF